MTLLSPHCKIGKRPGEWPTDLTRSGAIASRTHRRYLTGLLEIAVCLSVCSKLLSVCLSVCLLEIAVCLSVCSKLLSVCLSARNCCLSVCLVASSAVCLSRRFFCLSVCLVASSVCLSVSSLLLVASSRRFFSSLLLFAFLHSLNAFIARALSLWTNTNALRFSFSAKERERMKKHQSAVIIPSTTALEMFLSYAHPKPFSAFGSPLPKRNKKFGLLLLLLLPVLLFHAPLLHRDRLHAVSQQLLALLLLLLFPNNKKQQKTTNTLRCRRRTPLPPEPSLFFLFSDCRRLSVIWKDWEEAFAVTRSKAVQSEQLGTCFSGGYDDDCGKSKTTPSFLLWLFVSSKRTGEAKSAERTNETTKNNIMKKRKNIIMKKRKNIIMKKRKNIIMKKRKNIIMKKRKNIIMKKRKTGKAATRICSSFFPNDVVYSPFNSPLRSDDPFSLFLRVQEKIRFFARGGE